MQLINNSRNSILNKKSNKTKDKKELLKRKNMRNMLLMINHCMLPLEESKDPHETTGAYKCQKSNKRNLLLFEGPEKYHKNLKANSDKITKNLSHKITSVLNEHQLVIKS